MYLVIIIIINIFTAALLLLINCIYLLYANYNRVKQIIPKSRKDLVYPPPKRLVEHYKQGISQ